MSHPEQPGDGNRADQEADAAGRLRESASRIWLAGLGALARAQEQGGKVFENLVREGQELQRKGQAAAGETFNQAGSRMAGMAAGLSEKASGQWDRMEDMLEDRLERVLRRMGVPTRSELESLEARVAELERELDERRD